MRQRFIPRSTSLKVVALMSLFSLWLIAVPSAARMQQDKPRQLTQEEAGKQQSPSDRRIALVIGNGAYTNAPILKNPPNDARDMAAALSKLGFTVEHGVDLNQKQMKFMIRQFGQKLKAGGQGVFYYAGHGVQSKGRNYLIPVDAQIESEADVEDAGVDMQLLLNYMDDAQNGLNIVILDACRNNPFGRSMRSAENGLAQVDAPTGTLIAYATAPGRVASDGAGQNGLYTSELLKQMRTPGLSVTEMFMRVRSEVVKQTAGKQVPWEASSLIGTFAFNTAATSVSNTATSASNTPNKPAATLADPATVEAEYWESIKNSTDAADFRDYLKEYPNGRYAPLARSNQRRLEAPKNSASSPTNANTGAQPTLSTLESQLIGTWTWSKYKVTYYAGGRGVFYGDDTKCYEFSYYLTGDVMSFTPDTMLPCGPGKGTYRISFNNGVLQKVYIENGFTTEWTRKH